MSEKGANRAYFSLGSNIEPERNLPAAVRELSQFGRVLAVSRVWETAPVGFANQPNYLNAAVLLETPLSAEALCSETVPTIESRLGRVRDPHNKSGPRTIDIDLSLFNRDLLVVGHRTIPAPDILTRTFVAVPLAELDPDYIHPIENRSLSVIAATLAPILEMRLRADVLLH